MATRVHCFRVRLRSGFSFRFAAGFLAAAFLAARFFRGALAAIWRHEAEDPLGDQLAAVLLQEVRRPLDPHLIARRVGISSMNASPPRG